MECNVAVNFVLSGHLSPSPRVAPIQLKLVSERISMRALLARAVTEQVKYLVEQQRVAKNVVSLTVARQYLTAKDIEMQARTGRIGKAALDRTQGKESEVNLGAKAGMDVDFQLADAIADAIAGFEAQAFRVVVEGEWIETLDEEVVLKSQSKIVFLRLTPLVGG